MSKLYEVPKEYFFRIHHIRPRFKNDVENVLFYMATEIAKLKPGRHNKFKEELNITIKLYPGNTSKKIKTINNWRTEISSLFGLIEYEKEISMPGRMALLLSENQDLIEFFRYFLFYFQYPGGHLKSHETLEFIKAGIKFKPAKYLMGVIWEGRKLTEGGKFGLTKAEATHCIFNDLRVTRYNRSARETAKIILENRRNNITYDNGGDITRYAGDILDYMELADLVKLKPNYQYYLNMVNLETIKAFAKDNTYFDPYKPLYEKKYLQLSDVVPTQRQWFHYVNNKLDSTIFEADILSIIEEAGETTTDVEKSRLINEVLSKIRSSVESEQGIRTKEVGDIGETIVIEHEKTRMIIIKREDLIHLIKKIPESYAVGYDIASFEGISDIRRYIEVKTTISRGKLATKNFHMTSSEWSAANTLRKTYYVYRLMISTADVGLFLIQDPVGKYKEDLIDMMPREGADISYSDKSGQWEKLLV
jgi:hypothetical protein